jgi:conjugative transfer signal peptidase TraF
LILFVVTCFIAAQLGFRINSTPSVPEGLWKVAALTGPMQRGQIVSIYPTDTATFKMALARHYLSWGLCPGGYTSLLKPVAAIPGDCVAVSGEGIAINGVLVPNSKALKEDSIGRPLQAFKTGAYTVNPGTVWLVSQNTRSFDSRYFGPLPTANILGTAKPIWVGGTTQ